MSLTGAGLRTMRSVPNFGTVGALAELIDNSIQWRVKGKICQINVILIEKGRNKTVKDVIITDNGQGMGEIVDTCLYFGGGTNHGAKKGLGKYGVGLPYACCSQSELYHVYTWQKGGPIKHVYRDHSETAEDALLIDKPHEVVAGLPNVILQTCPEVSSQESGTIIYLKDCDEVDPKKASTIINHTNEKLGRIYRHFISDEIIINWRPFKQASENQSPTLINGLPQKLQINDPLRLISSGTILGNSPYNIEPGHQDIFDIRPDKPIPLYSKPDPSLDGHEHWVEITGSLAKEKYQKPGGADGGRTNIGKLCARSGKMISLVRADRELKLGNFSFEAPNSSDPRLRWMKIEVKFDPISDKLFGVNANKTNAQKFRCIKPEQYDEFIIGNDGDIPWDVEFMHEISTKINLIIDDLFKEIKNRGTGGRKPKSKCSKCLSFTVRNGTCENCGPLDVCSEHNQPYENGICPLCESVVTPRVCVRHKIQLDDEGNCPSCNQKPQPLTEDERDRLERILKENYAFKNCTEAGIQSSIDWFVQSGKEYFVIFAPDDIHTESLLAVSRNPNFTLLLLNTSHPFYDSHIAEHYERGDEGLEALILFLISWISAESSAINDAELLRKYEKFRSRFGLELAENLSEWVKITKS